jgi:hypothetical protein
MGLVSRRFTVWRSAMAHPSAAAPAPAVLAPAVERGGVLDVVAGHVLQALKAEPARQRLAPGPGGADDARAPREPLRQARQARLQLELETVGAGDARERQRVLHQPRLLPAMVADVAVQPLQPEQPRERRQVGDDVVAGRPPQLRQRPLELAPADAVAAQVQQRLLVAGAQAGASASPRRACSPPHRWQTPSGRRKLPARPTSSALRATTN